MRDIDTAVVDSLKALDPKRPIKEATDGSELAGRALTHGFALAKEVKAPVTVVTVTQPWSAFDMAHKAREG